MPLPTSYAQMLSTVNSNGELRLALAQVDMPTPGPDEVVIKIEATPINPSDLGVMFGWSTMTDASTIIFYKTVSNQSIQIIRILHKSMDVILQLDNS